MSFLTASPFSLASIFLQINPSGVEIGDLRVEDVSESWLAREKALALRDAEDALPSEIVTLSGARTVVSFAPTHTIPMNNEAQLGALYKKILYRNIRLTGAAMDSSDYSVILNHYDIAQRYWLARQKLLEQLAAPDIPFQKVQDLASNYAALTVPTMPLVTPLLSGNVTFAQGASCTFSQAFENYVTNFSLNLIQEVVQ